MCRCINNVVVETWRRRTGLSYVLMPFSWIFKGIAALRRSFYSFFNNAMLSVPVIVVGNLTVGGTGKTPFVIGLVEALKKEGWSPGIITRGYRGNKRAKDLIFVEASTSVRVVGDEAVLLARRTACPVVVGNKRLAAAKLLQQRFPVDVIISDDGLQHYALPRQIEIVMIDPERWGNGLCLPAGPLREGIWRLKTVDFVIAQGKKAASAQWGMTTRLSTTVVGVNISQRQQALVAFRGKTVHAIAGIGVPERFFQALEALSIEVIRHPYPDHYFFKAADLIFQDDLPILMTEKDAVKCEGIVPHDNAWCVGMDAILPEECFFQIIRRLRNG